MNKLRWRWPDRPIETRSLQMVREGEWYSTSKVDGHYCIISKDNGQITTFSRHNKPLPVSKDLIAELCDAVKLEDGVVIHAEWTGRREANTKEGLYLFSITYKNYNWLGGLTEEERYHTLNELVTNAERVSIIPARTSGYATHYKETIDDLRFEGIVLKKRNTKLVGGLNKSYPNPGFLKLKWRGAADGQFRCIVPDQDLITMV